MSEYNIIKDEVLDFYYTEGLNGNAVPTMRKCANHCNQKKLTTPRNKEITISTIQQILSDESLFKTRWNDGMEEYLQKHPENQELINYNSYSIREIRQDNRNKLKQFCIDYCKHLGSINNSRPTMRQIVDHCNTNNVKSTIGGIVNLSTIQQTITSDEIYNAWNEENSKLEKENETPIQFINLNENIEMIDVIKRYCFGKGFMDSKKPSLDDISGFVNQEGFRTPIRKQPYTATTLHRFITMHRIDVVNEWRRGLNQAKEATGRTTQLHEAIRECAYQWGMMRSITPPHLPQLAELLFQRGFIADNGKRLTTTYIQTVIVNNGINVRQEWDRGWNDSNEKIRREKEEMRNELLNQTLPADTRIQQNTQQNAHQPILQPTEQPIIRGIEYWKHVRVKNANPNPTHNPSINPCLVPDETIPIPDHSVAQSHTSQPDPKEERLEGTDSLTRWLQSQNTFSNQAFMNSDE